MNRGVDRGFCKRLERRQRPKVSLIAPVWFTGRADLMGAYRNRPLTNLAAIAGMATVLALNVVLLLQTAGMSL